MNTHKVKSNLLLLLAAAIWGFAFVAQRVGGKYIGAFTFNGIRFALGGISLLPLILYNNKSSKRDYNIKQSKQVLKVGIIAGFVIFLGASSQQLGLANTAAGKAAFITGLYIVIVPILGKFLKRHININSWVGALIAVMGLYFLCVTNKFSLSNGDLLELACAFFFSLHIMLIDYYSKKVDVLKLALFQFFTCSILSLTTGFFIEKTTLASIYAAAIPLLYGGILSSGVAYTLQIIGQKNADPSEAAIVMSMESVFATIGGILILNEKFGPKGILGCALMLAGMLLAQLNFTKKSRPRQ